MDGWFNNNKSETRVHQSSTISLISKIEEALYENLPKGRTLILNQGVTKVVRCGIRICDYPDLYCSS